MKISHEWHKSFFRNSFYNPVNAASLAKAPSEAAFVLKQLKLKRDAALLDLCCGPGRHSVVFAKKGLNVTGYDFSTEYLAEAAASAKKAKVPLRLVRGDMRRLKFSGQFDAAVNLFTSFGYFQRFLDDIKTLKGVARALKPGGLFLIDLIHGDYARKNLHQRYWYDMGEFYHLEDVTLTDDGTYNTWTRIWKKGGKTQKRTFFSRFYGKERLSCALNKAGLKPLRFWGDFKGSRLSENRNRLICLARKS